MSSIPNCICMIPARIGSQRFRKKNLALIGNKSILELGIENAINANIFDEIIVNGDDEVFELIAKKKGVKFYKRENQLGSSDTKSDDVVFDFIGAPPYNFIYSDGNQQYNLNGINANQYILSTNNPGTYSLISLDDANCNGIFTGSANDDLIRVQSLKTKTFLKRKTDQGSTTVTASDSQGTGKQVNFAETFVDVDAISLTIRGSSSSAKYAIYDFVDSANPQNGFKVFLFDNNGNGVAGTVDFTVRGV